MRTQVEVRERVEHWRSVLAGILKGEETKKTVRHIIKELEWVLENDEGRRDAKALDLEAR